MSKLDELIQQYCPNGVEYKNLGQLGTFENIGVDKKINSNERKVKLLNYMDIYNIPYIDNAIPSMVVSASDKKIENCTCNKGDIFITPTSETREDIGHAAVITEDLKNTVYSYHIIRFRLNEFNLTNSFFIRYLFESELLKKQIYKASKGITRFGLLKKDFCNLSIPLPPLPVQEEIVRILDNFSKVTKDLTKNLDKELEACKKQYEYYRDELLNFDKINKYCPNGIKYKKLEEFATINRGGSLQKKDFVDKGIPCIHYGQIYTKYGLFADKTFTYISEKIASKQKFAEKNDIVMAVTSENLKDVCSCLAWLGNEKIAISGHTAIIHHNQNAKFMSYYFHSIHFQKQKNKLAHGTKVIEVTPSKLKNIIIPVPSIVEQECIVDILDKFEVMYNNLYSEISAEIELRKKQYEYYRDKILTFKELK